MSVIPVEIHSLEQFIGCVFGVIAGLIVQGEAQMYFMMMFQLLSQRTRVHYDLNPSHHIGLSTLPPLLLAGWGWTKKRFAEPEYFPDSWVHRSLVPLAGPVANMILVGILGTFYIFLPYAIFEAAILINIQIAIANIFIPIPPLALGRALCRSSGTLSSLQPFVEQAGAILLASLVAVQYFFNVPVFQWVYAMSAGVAKWVLNL